MSPASGLRRPVLARVLRGRCPRCGDGALFRRYARLWPACPACGLQFRREAGSATGSMYISAAVTQVFTAGVIAVLWFATDWSLPVSLAVGATVVLAFCFAFLPLSMSLWAGVEYLTDVHNGDLEPPAPH